jgi:hypothetical protein
MKVKLTLVTRFCGILIAILATSCSPSATVGLDPATRQLIEDAIKELGQQPDRWDQVLTGLIDKASGDMKEVLSALKEEMTDFTREIVEDGGIELRCDVDFVGQKVRNALQQILNNDGPNYSLSPWICHLRPEEFTVDQNGRASSDDFTIAVTGFGFTPDNVSKGAEIQVVDENGAIIETIVTTPNFVSAYRMDLNIQGLQFPTNPRNKLRVIWTNDNYYTEAAILLEPTPTPPPTPVFPIGSITFHRYTINGHHYNTNISSEDHECGIVGMAARDGDINENDAGDILQAYMEDEDGTWRITADFRTHNHDEKWTIYTICLPKSSSVTLIPYKGIGDNVGASDRNDVDTGMNSSEFFCGVVGMAARDGDIDENDTADILKAYMEDKDGTWHVRADFGSHNKNETWDINVLCVSRTAQPEAFSFPVKFHGLRGQTDIPTGIHTQDWLCGIVGMAALEGNINENDAGDIIKAYLEDKDGIWHIIADFRTHNVVAPPGIEIDGREHWDIDLLCVSTDIATYEE